MSHESLNFKFSLNQEVFWLSDGTPATGRIIRRGYQETWHDPEPDSMSRSGGYTTNNFYEVKGWYGIAVFHESDFGRKVFDNPTEFARFITKPEP